ncbi:MAG: DoxX family protein [Gammaproteobacteria bacterium]|nr:DoxX family protein [Gammaproteobacteria bacterium]
MEKLIELAQQAHTGLLNISAKFDFIAPLLLRLYLAPILWMAGTGKFSDFESTVAWFGNSDWGLGLPLPALMAFLSASTETLGALLLIFGLGVRWISLPLMITMIVAAVSVHIQHGWQAIADTKFCLFNCADAEAAAVRLDKAKELLQEHGNYNWLTEQGSLVVLNNGIEFAATYFIMLLALLYLGAGKLSLDYLIRNRYLAH